jgi:hypothetical protein
MLAIYSQYYSGGKEAKSRPDKLQLPSGKLAAAG